MTNRGHRGTDAAVMRNQLIATGTPPEDVTVAYPPQPADRFRTTPAPAGWDSTATPTGD